MDDLVKSSYQYCYWDDFESFVGDSDSVDLAECESEKVVRVWLVDPSFQSNLSWAFRKLQDAKLIIDRCGFQFDGMGVQRRTETFEEQAMLSDKLTVLVNDIGNGLAANELFKARLLNDMKRVIEILVNPFF